MGTRVFVVTCDRTQAEVEFRITGDFDTNTPSGMADLACPMCGGEHLFFETEPTDPRTH